MLQRQERLGEGDRGTGEKGREKGEGRIKEVKGQRERGKKER